MQTAVGELPARLWRDMTMAEAHEYLVGQRVQVSRRRFLQGMGAATGLAVAGPVLWRRPAWATEVAAQGVHLAYGADPKSTVDVSWMTTEAVASPQVAVGGSPVSASTQTVAGHPGRHYHRASVGPLSAGTTSPYEVLHNGTVVTTGSFTTAPASAGAFRFATFGDMGANSAGATITQRVVEQGPDYVFFVGDLCYADRLGGAFTPPAPLGPGPVFQDLRQWDLWLAQIEPSAKETPWMTTVGNHEMEIGQGPLGYDGYRARMSIPGAGPAGSPLYVSRYANVAFVALDANDVSYELPKNRGYIDAGANGTNVQRGWLRARLTELRDDSLIDFIVLGFHHCSYCSNTVHGSDGGVRDAFAAEIDEHTVDLVVNGHNHSYERTHAIRNGAVLTEVPKGATVVPASDGTIYVCAGGGGQAPYPTTVHPVSYVWTPDRQREPEIADWSAVRYLGDHSLVVADVTPGDATTAARMEVKAYDSAGTTVVDHFVLER